VCCRPSHLNHRAGKSPAEARLLGTKVETDSRGGADFSTARLSMKYKVLCGNVYAQEVDAESETEAMRAAFAIKLPLAIGEIIGVQSANPKKKTGWNSAAYMLTSHALGLIGARGIYKPHKRGFVLDTESPLIERVPPKDT
jgi:hypothetical protein